MPSSHTSFTSPLLFSSSHSHLTNSIRPAQGFLSEFIAFNMETSPYDPSCINSDSGGLPARSSLNSGNSRFESLSWRLGNFDSSLAALNELRSEFFTGSQHILPDNEFRLSASKLMDLLDIAKHTLEEAGVDLWPHALCVVGLRRHKKAYFALLKLLRSRADCLDPPLQARSRKFTCRLSTNFSIRVNPAYDLYLPPKPRNPRRKIVKPQPPQQKILCKSMPPPDAFPPSEFTPVSSHSYLVPQRHRRRMQLELSSDVWESLGLELPSHPKSYNGHESVGSRRPGMTKHRYGIFCMGQSVTGRRGLLRT
ncbi:hypothetical protein J3R30DRAFT_3700389 [Lentinula aciculospora]|uniref:Uncharacterized protein n=1 Tax=Lentinula aciculospora TaxID=153920 RepID=A0A9W9DRA2_9AGAR|nr:hypothetical protein J3R30DRAFT_3700389 [Lentinula aciculospora]